MLATVWFIYFSLVLVVFACSLAAFKALKSFSILQLPLLTTLQAFTGTFLHEAGVMIQSTTLKNMMI